MNYTIIESYGGHTWTPFTDWIPALNVINDKDTKTIFELGLGLGTKALLSKFKHVYSFEVARDIEWYNKSLEDYKSATNWTSKFYTMKELGLDIADEALLNSGGDVRDTDTLQIYFDKLSEFVPDFSIIDVAFVDQGFHFRGESVTYFLNKGIKEVLVHDTLNHDHIYGYDKIVIPSNYTSQEFGGLGTRLYTRP